MRKDKKSGAVQHTGDVLGTGVSVGSELALAWLAVAAHLWGGLLRPSQTGSPS